MVEETKKTDGIYCGKILKKKGTRKDKDGKEVNWELWRLQFKNNLEDTYDFGFSTFDTDVETKFGLKQGEVYTIAYTESPNKQYPDKPHKKFSSASPGALPKDHAERNGIRMVDEEEFKFFVENYFETMKDLNKEPYEVHMMGSYLATYCESAVEKLLEKCRNAINDKLIDKKEVKV